MLQISLATVNAIFNYYHNQRARQNDLNRLKLQEKVMIRNRKVPENSGTIQQMQCIPHYNAYNSVTDRLVR